MATATLSKPKTTSIEKPYLAEMDSRIKEAREWGNIREMEFAIWQRKTIIREHAARVRRQEARARKGA